MFGVSPLDYIQSLEFAIKEYHIPELPAISSDFNLRTILVENESHFASDDLKLGDPVHYSSQRTLSYSTIPVDDNSESDDVEFMEFAQRTELYDPYIPRTALFGDSRTKRQRQSSDLSIIEDNDDDDEIKTESNENATLIDRKGIASIAIISYGILQVFTNKKTKKFIHSEVIYTVLVWKDLKA